MKRLVMASGLLCILMTSACERDTPPKPVGSATNKHFEESSPSIPNDAARELSEAMKSPMKKAHQAEGTVQRGAAVTSNQAEQATQ